MIPFFFLKIRKGRDYLVFNPADNREYVINYTAYRILEMCDGACTTEEIVESVIRDFGLTEEEAREYVEVFLHKMTKAAMMAWREEKMNPDKNFPPPSTVFWDITGACNLRCFHCYYFDKGSHEKELSTEEIKMIIEELASSGVENISFSGGEPLMRKDVPEIAIHAAGLGFRSVGLSTNGTLITRKISKKLKAANLDIQVSIDGDNAEIHDRMRGVKGAFDRAIHGIKILQDEGIEPSACTTVTNWNVDRIPDIIRLVQELGMKNYRVQGVVPVGRGNMNACDLKLTPGRMKELVEYLESREITVSSYNFTLKPPPDGTVDFCESGACSAASTICSITAEGNVVPCTYVWGMNGDNLRDHTFRWIWENSVLLNYFRTIRMNDIKGVCRECKWLSLCRGGCKAENYINGDIFESNRSCWVADEIIRRK